MAKWIVAVFLLICLVATLYFFGVIGPKPQDDCSIVAKNRTAGVDFSLTASQLETVKGKLALSTGDTREIDVLLNDFGTKY